MTAGSVRANSSNSRKVSRYEANLESSPHLLEQLQAAAEESLSLRDEVVAAKMILGESIRMLGRATAQNDGVMPQAVAGLILGQMREVNALVSSCAAIEAKRVDQQFDAAKMILLLGRLRTDICLALKEAGMAGAVPFVQAAFGRARWTGALDQGAVDEALAAPASFDIKFRPIERDTTGKLREHSTAFDTPEEALAGAADLDLTPRSAKLIEAREKRDLRTPAAKAEDSALKAELEAANNGLDQQIDAEIAAAEEGGNPLPGVSELRSSKLKDSNADLGTGDLLKGK